MSNPEVDDFNADSNWRMLGACRGLDPEVFYPDEDADAEAAKEVCRQCIVRVKCLEFALETREKHGVWGGATERERRAMLSRKARAARRLARKA